MVCDICKDTVFLAQKAAPATAEDLGAAQDLLDTLIAHKDGCVGMAANMIGVCRRIIAFDDEGAYTVMLNPVIVRQSGAYEAEEGCLSLPGIRKTKRFQTIKVQWQNERLQTRCKLYDRVMSGPVNPIFYGCFVKDRAFTVSDACIGCGQCVRLCPTNNITLREGKPVWGGDCTHCMACICRCPAEAIEYGRKSVGKPRYHFEAL